MYILPYLKVSRKKGTAFARFVFIQLGKKILLFFPTSLRGTPVTDSQSLVLMHWPSPFSMFLYYLRSIYLNHGRQQNTSLNKRFNTFPIFITKLLVSNCIKKYCKTFRFFVNAQVQSHNLQMPHYTNSSKKNFEIEILTT